MGTSILRLLGTSSGLLREVILPSGYLHETRNELHLERNFVLS